MYHPLLPTCVSRNGCLIPPQDATLSVLGSTLYGAWGVYESIQLWNHTIFHLDAHLVRLLESAAQIELSLAGDGVAHHEWVEQLIEQEGERAGAPIAQATIRLFAVGDDGDEHGYRSFIWLMPVHAPSSPMYGQGVGGIVYQGERALPQAKSLNTLVNTLARRRATSAGEHEGLLVDRDGNVREGATSNLCVLRKGTLLVPPPEEILGGVTLQIVLALAAEAGIPVERQQLPLKEWESWEEAFLTSTSRHVLPLVRLDGRMVGDGTPGKLTRQLHRHFEEYFISQVGAPYLADG